MTGMSWEHAAAVRQALHAIVTDPDYGAAALSSTRTMTNLLNDLLPDAPREKIVLIGAADGRVAEILLDRTAHGLDASLAINQAASSLAAATVFPREVCDWAATEFAVALGLSQGGALPEGAGPGPAGPGPAGSGPAGPGSDDLQDATTTGRGGTRREVPGRRDQDVVTILPPGPGGQPGGRWRSLEPRRRTTLLTAGGALAAVVVVVIAIVAWPSPGPPAREHHHHHLSPSPSPTPPSPSPSPTVESLTTIMNPAGSAPVATGCSSAPLQGLDPATLTSRLYCTHATNSHVVVWAYQFDSPADYQAGVPTLNKNLKFNPATAAKGCPPPSGHSDGDTGWRSRPNYPDRTGQNLECYTGGGEPVLVWTMPSQNVVFLAEYKVKGTPMADLVNWWKTTSYG